MYILKDAVLYDLFRRSFQTRLADNLMVGELLSTERLADVAFSDTMAQAKVLLDNDIVTKKGK